MKGNEVDKSIINESFVRCRKKDNFSRCRKDIRERIKAENEKETAYETKTFLRATPSWDLNSDSEKKAFGLCHVSS